MLEIPRWTASLPEILARDSSVPAELALELGRLVTPMLVFQEHPCLAARAVMGLVVPAHQRLLQDAMHRGAPSTVIIGSRGTSKTATAAVVYHTFKSLFWSKRKAVVIQASGFRGGQLIFEDLERMAVGAWVDQDSDLQMVARSMRGEKLIKRSQNFWSIDWSSLSSSYTVPTNDAEKLRGMRATDLLVDEANFADMVLVDKVASSFLNVLQDFKTGGEAALTNTVIYTTTVDYGWREFQQIAQAAYAGLERELDALRAAQAGQWDLYQEYERKGLHRSTWVCLDYTDTIMTRYITTRDGRRFEVRWPDPERKWRQDPQGIPYSVRGEDGRMQKEGVPCEIITTYPINRIEMEGKLLSGESAEPVWLAEQRNVEDTAAGDVYPHHVVDEVVCKGNRFVIPWAECGEAWQKTYESHVHYRPTVMWSCSDPCVVGVDYAPGARDFCALVVIRVGPLAQGPFDPVRGIGSTPWSNVIWTEQHRNASGAKIAEKLRAYAERYNLAFFHDPHQLDPWQACRAIGLDCRGGGNTVRDELVFINDEVVPAGKYRILDPLDPDERVQAFRQDADAKPMLDALLPTAQLNDKLVEFTLAQLSNHLLYLPADVPLSERPLDPRLDIAYDGARILEHQLRALQQAPTPGGYRRFFMKGDKSKVVNKKDFWSAFIYGSKQLRAHLLRVRLIDNTPPPTGGVVTRMGKWKGGRVAMGARR